nr:MAG TPA: hypothetical protein [Caudoviricetes sp.]
MTTLRRKPVTLSETVGGYFQSLKREPEGVQGADDWIPHRQNEKN